MGFKDEITEFHKAVISVQDREELEKVSDEDALIALLVLNFIKYKKVPDVFWGCAALNMLNVYRKQNVSKINYQYRRHILNILKGIEDINQFKAIKVTFDDREGLSLLIISFWDFQFSFQSQHSTNLIQRISSKNDLVWDGVRKQKCAKTIFDFARFNNWMSDSTLGNVSLRDFIEREVEREKEGGYIFEKGNLLKIKGLNPAQNDIDLHLKNYVRQKLYECQDRPVIISAIFRRIWDKHITFTSVKPYIANIRVVTICNHINLFKPDVEKVLNVAELVEGQRYYIIGYCKPYPYADRMGVMLAVNMGKNSIVRIDEFFRLPKDILSECHRFSIEDYLSMQQKKIKL